MDETRLTQFIILPDRTWIERDLRTRFPKQAERVYEYERAVDSGELSASAWQSCGQAQSNMLRWAA